VPRVPRGSTRIVRDYLLQRLSEKLFRSEIRSG
jgi:hypothetical protein